METMSARGNDSHDNNQMMNNNGKTQFSRHDGAKTFVNTTGFFKKDSFGFSHFELDKVALECLNTGIGKKENTRFTIGSTHRDSSGILCKMAWCTKNGKRTGCERRIKIVELHPNDWVAILGLKKTLVCL